jgi:hypothetical protein
VLIAIDTEGEDKDPGHGELGSRVQVLYVPVAEVAAIEVDDG